MALKKIVILTADDLAHRYIVNQLCENIEIQAIIVAGNKQDKLWKKLKRYPNFVLLSKLSRSLFLHSIRDQKKSKKVISNVLGRLSQNFKHEELIRYFPNINDDSVYDYLTEIKPDAILVYGCGIVKSHILQTSSDLAFNMHTGISPYYRGTHCTFWPIANNELNMIGSTVHECTTVIDGGKIFATRQARIEPQDSIHEIFARCVITGADIYIEVIKQYLKGRLEGTMQNYLLGKEYRSSMRTLSVELRTRWKIRQGLVRDYFSSLDSHR